VKARAWSIVLWMLAAACLPACDPTDACDPGYYADHGACFLPRPPRDPSADAGSAPDGAVPFNEQDFGYACTTDADCGGSAPRCGSPQLPICTAVNCLSGEGRCPATWKCLDVSTWTPDPKIQSVCVNFDI
jgi:hypothetical protein